MVGILGTHDRSLEGTKEAGGEQDTRIMVWKMASLPLRVGLQVGWRRRCEVQGLCLLPTLYIDTSGTWDHLPVTAF